MIDTVMSKIQSKYGPAKDSMIVVDSDPSSKEKKSEKEQKFPDGFEWQVVAAKSSTSKIQVISEEPNEDDIDFKEEEFLEEIKQIEKRQGLNGEEEDEKDDNRYAVKKTIKVLDKTNAES